MPNESEAVSIAQRLLATLRKPFGVSGETVQVGASIGVSLFPWDGADAKTLSRNADSATYEAKRLGRNRVQFFNPEMEAAIVEKSALREVCLTEVSCSVDHLRKLQRGTAQIDRRRFRPNIYIESEAGCGGFVEDSWLGGALEIGGVVKVEDFQPTVWCVTSTLAQQDLPRDLSILRTTAQHHRGCLGVYATVTRSGLLQVGDVAYLVKQGTDTAYSVSGSA